MVLDGVMSALCKTRTAHELPLYDWIMDTVGRYELNEVASIAISAVKIELHRISGQIYEWSLHGDLANTYPEHCRERRPVQQS